MTFYSIILREWTTGLVFTQSGEDQSKDEELCQRY